ncbi:MAG TPA: DUF1579 domain-containing protein [Chthoniobacterales bacterium]|nr:DUF1579 domain-containing protein [Chthoniobacterales bacterium]
MKTSLFVTAFLAAASLATTSSAQQPGTSPAPGGKASNSGTVPVPANPATAQPNAADMDKMMQQMMELSKLNENHKLIASLDGTWNCNVKMWMDGDTSKKPDVSKSTAVRKSIMDGRYVIMDVTGKMEMPGPDGKKKEITFKGQGTEGYDNVKKKFVGTWMDNMGTGIMMSEGDYDPATKSFTYTGVMEVMPGMKQKIREVVKLTDKDHMDFEWYEDRGGKEMKTMEINYTKKK